MNCHVVKQSGSKHICNDTNKCTNFENCHYLPGNSHLAILGWSYGSNAVYCIGHPEERKRQREDRTKKREEERTRRKNDSFEEKTPRKRGKKVKITLLLSIAHLNLMHSFFFVFSVVSDIH